VQVLSAVQRRHRAVRDWPKQRKVKLVDVEMQNVEFVSGFAHPVEHQHVVRDRVTHIRIEPQRHRGTRNDISAGH